MNTLVLFTILLLSIEMIVARPQQGQIEPAYLRDYYAQLAQQNGPRGSVADATPIFEQNTSFQPSGQLATVGQQIRVRDPVQEQVNARFFLNAIGKQKNMKYPCRMYRFFKPEN